MQLIYTKIFLLITTTTKLNFDKINQKHENQYYSFRCKFGNSACNIAAT